uniref:Uncharacterized protein n=1 Tax=Nelumbo nucifera TaxID=4432 RepID=A0A822Z842_NELNU|nr:TPA_asm: hypothetical protein HUJ06_013519 [Nelumbo nucifera]
MGQTKKEKKKCKRENERKRKMKGGEREIGATTYLSSLRFSSSHLPKGGMAMREFTSMV